MTTQRVVLEITTSLDGFVAGPDAGFEHPLGIGGMQIHEWAFATRAFCEHHGMPGGEAGPDSEVIEAHLAAVGATIMGRRMFSGGSGPWDGDPNASGWWGDEPPFRHPVFVLTHHAREPLELGGGTTFTFVTGGVEQALELARVAAGDKNVAVSGGASVAQQFVTRGLLDDLQIHVCRFSSEAACSSSARSRSTRCGSRRRGSSHPRRSPTSDSPCRSPRATASVGDGAAAPPRRHRMSDAGHEDRSRRPGAERLADLPVVAEGICDPPEQPAVLLLHRVDLRRAGCDGPLDR